MYVLDFIGSNRDEHSTHQTWSFVSNDRSSGNGLKGFIGCNFGSSRAALVALVQERQSHLETPINENSLK